MMGMRGPSKLGRTQPVRRHAGERGPDLPSTVRGCQRRALRALLCSQAGRLASAQVIGLLMSVPRSRRQLVPAGEDARPSDGQRRTDSGSAEAPPSPKTKSCGGQASTHRQARSIVGRAGQRSGFQDVPRLSWMRRMARTRMRCRRGIVRSATMHSRSWTLWCGLSRSLPSAPHPLSQDRSGLHRKGRACAKGSTGRTRLTWTGDSRCGREQARCALLRACL